MKSNVPTLPSLPINPPLEPPLTKPMHTVGKRITQGSSACHLCPKFNPSTIIHFKGSYTKEKTTPLLIAFQIPTP